MTAIAACSSRDDGNDCPSLDESEPNDSAAQANILGSDEDVFDCHGVQAPSPKPFGSYYVDARCGASDVEDWFGIEMLNVGGGHGVGVTVKASSLAGMRLAMQGSGFTGDVFVIDEAPGDGLFVGSYSLQGPATLAVFCSSTGVTAARSYELTVDFFCDCD